MEDEGYTFKVSTKLNQGSFSVESVKNQKEHIMQSLLQKDTI